MCTRNGDVVCFACVLQEDKKEDAKSTLISIKSMLGMYHGVRHKLGPNTTVANGNHCSSDQTPVPLCAPVPVLQPTPADAVWLDMMKTDFKKHKTKSVVRSAALQRRRVWMAEWLV